MYLTSFVDWQAHSHIGGRKIDGVWKWQGRLTGEITYDWWGSGDPNGDGECLGFHGLTLKFNDQACTGGHSFKFFCENANSQ